MATSSPTKQITPWAISEGVVTPIATFSDNLAVSYDIGPQADDVTFTLFNLDCETESASDAITLVPSAFTGGSASFEIEFDTGEFASDTGGFVTNEGSLGSVEFCVRASSYEEDIDVVYKDTEFTLTYSLTDLSYEVVSISIEAATPDSFVETDIGDSFTIFVCQCGIDGICAASTVSQNDPLFICLSAANDNADAAASVVISNFNMIVSAGEGDELIEYFPVELGANTYEPNSLTSVTVDEDETVIVSTLLISAFYTEGFAEVAVDGLAFLEFATTGARTFQEYGLMLELEGAAVLGCFAFIFKTIGGFF